MTAPNPTQTRANATSTPQTATSPRTNDEFNALIRSPRRHPARPKLNEVGSVIFTALNENLPPEDFSTADVVSLTNRVVRSLGVAGVLP